MTATERLRALLDERGVEWSNVFTGTGDVLDNLTEWNVPNAGWVEAWEYGGHLSYTWHMGEKPSPEQAVEVTLGRSCASCPEMDNPDSFISHLVTAERYERGECHAVWEADAMTEDERVGEYVCSECGETFGDGHGEFPRYCPNCGRRVEC